MKERTFIQFMQEFSQYDSALVESIVSGYRLIFENAEMPIKLPNGSDYTYYMDLSQDTFIHFTLLSRAESMIESKTMSLNYGKRGLGPEGIFAVSEAFGQYVPSVQLYVKKFNPDNEQVVALEFKTNTVPDYGHPEEVIWKSDVSLINPRIISVEDAEKKLAPRDDSMDYFSVTYRKEDAKL